MDSGDTVPISVAGRNAQDSASVCTGEAQALDRSDTVSTRAPTCSAEAEHTGDVELLSSAAPVGTAAPGAPTQSERAGNNIVSTPLVASWQDTLAQGLLEPPMPPPSNRITQDAPPVLLWTVHMLMHS